MNLRDHKDRIITIAVSIVLVLLFLYNITDGDIFKSKKKLTEEEILQQEQYQNCVKNASLKYQQNSQAIVGRFNNNQITKGEYETQLEQNETSYSLETGNCVSVLPAIKKLQDQQDAQNSQYKYQIEKQK